MKEWFIDILSSILPIGDYYVEYVYKLVLLLIVVLLSCLFARIVKVIVLGRLKKFILSTDTKYDDLLIKHKVLDIFTYFIPILVVYILLPSFGIEGGIVERIFDSFMVLFALIIIRAVLNIVLEIYSNRKISKERPIKGYLQVVKVVLYVLGAIFIISFLTGSSPWGFLAGLGAMAAILALIFKDSILSLMAGFQMSSNNILHIGDWVDMPKYGADGTVVDIGLNTVKVSNWDKTITTIPTYSFVSDSFKNWRGMEEGDGRRIKRALYIDINTIHFCSDEELDSFDNLALIKDYVSQKREEISIYKSENNISLDDLSSRRLSNIGIFRKYVYLYLSANPNINKDMTFIVRQLPPCDNGLPIEIYVFSKDKVWSNYEDIQSDIFDHIISVVPVFGLRVFQRLTGYDFERSLGGRRI